MPSLVSKVVDFCCSCAAFHPRFGNSQATKYYKYPQEEVSQGSLPLKKLPKTPKGKDLSPNSQPSIFQGRGVKLRECIGVLPKFTALPCFTIKSRKYWCFFTMFFNTFLGILGVLP